MKHRKIFSGLMPPNPQAGLGGRMAGRLYRVRIKGLKAE